jgi:hypothetical protein
MVLWLREYFKTLKQMLLPYQKYLLDIVTRFGLAQDGDIEKTILKYMLDTVERALIAHNTPLTFDPDELLGHVATCLNLEFIEIHNDEDIQNLPSRLPFEYKTVVALLQNELRSKDTSAVTIRRQAYAHWERPFLAVIDCRKDYYSCGFFSKRLMHILCLIQSGWQRQSPDVPRAD